MDEKKVVFVLSKESPAILLGVFTNVKEAQKIASAEPEKKALLFPENVSFADDYNGQSPVRAVLKKGEDLSFEIIAVASNDEEAQKLKTEGSTILNLPVNLLTLEYKTTFNLAGAQEAKVADAPEAPSKPAEDAQNATSAETAKPAEEVAGDANEEKKEESGAPEPANVPPSE